MTDSLAFSASTRVFRFFKIPLKSLIMIASKNKVQIHFDPILFEPSDYPRFIIICHFILGSNANVGPVILNIEHINQGLIWQEFVHWAWTVTIQVLHQKKKWQKPVKMYQKLLKIISTISFWFWIPILVILALQRPKNTFSDPKFGPTDDKNAIETHF